MLHCLSRCHLSLNVSAASINSASQIGCKWLQRVIDKCVHHQLDIIVEMIRHSRLSIHSSGPCLEGGGVPGIVP